MSESHLYIGAAVVCMGAFVCAFVVCAASLVANRGGEGSLSQGAEGGSEATEPLDR